MTKETLRKILKSYSVDAIKDSLTTVYNHNKEIKERLTDKHIDAIVDKILIELKDEKEKD